MRVSRRSVVASLTPATRARTALAACSWLSWQGPAEPGTDPRAPYFDSAGTPVLLVERRTSRELLELGFASTELAALPELGLVRLHGELWPVAGNADLSALRRFRLEHAECSDCCGPHRCHLVGLRIARVEVTDPDDGGLTVVDLDAYAAADPDPVITHSLSVRRHLNTMHGDDLLLLASRTLELRAESLLAASVDWIDAWGLEISVIDEAGAGTHRLPFRRPLTTMDDLGGQLHAFLRSTGGRC